MGERNHTDIDTLRSELLAGDMGQYREYYESYKFSYFNFATRYTDDKELIADSYHDAFIALYENIVEGKVEQLQSSLKTYVFSIAKYSLFAKLRKRGREMAKEDIEEVEIPLFVSDSSDSDPRTEQVRSALQNMSEGCRQILTLFYYRRYTIDAIMHELKYKNENTVKAHKSRCLRKLREATRAHKAG